MGVQGARSPKVRGYYAANHHIAMNLQDSAGIRKLLHATVRRLWLRHLAAVLRSPGARAVVSRSSFDYEHEQQSPHLLDGRAIPSFSHGVTELETRHQRRTELNSTQRAQQLAALSLRCWASSLECRGEDSLMFRSTVRSSGVIRTSVGLLAAIVLATVLNFWLVAEIRKEQYAVAEIVRGGVQEDIQRLGTLPGELRWQLVFTIVVLVVLLVAAATLVFVVRAYLTSQATLRDTMTLARDILGSIDYGVITTDTEGHITSVNPQAQELLALKTLPIGEQLSTVKPNETPLAEMCQDVLATGTAVHDHNFAVDVRDRRRELRADCHCLCGSDRRQRGTVLHVRDVTQQMLLEQRMRRMERFMGLGTLAAGLHHEIKNPLSALLVARAVVGRGLGRPDR